MRRILPLAMVALLPLAGCVSARATMLGQNEQLPPVLETDVRVFLNEGQIPAECSPYALIHTTGAANMTDETDMIAAARRRAGKIGANGVLLGEVKEPGTGTQVVSAIFGVPANRKGQLVAYRCEAGRAAPSAGGAAAVPVDELPIYYVD
uniref:Lipoprotein n=1 Tax=uncultured bacterium esnapd22 TaxID=1366604 RepID=S5UD91_9BACT|nr:hypothetical protein [uncultured bacterium esnapd22]